MNEEIKNSFEKLEKWLESKPIEERFHGIDPFDGLNSPLVKRSFLGRSRLLRLIFVQFFKRSSINLRPIFGIKAVENPQALAIFLRSYCLLHKHEPTEKRYQVITHLADRICKLKEPGWSGACWSYPFAWQARAFYQPEHTPLIIPTAACANALLDAFDITGNLHYRETAISTVNFIKNDLNRTYDKELFAFSYSPKDSSVVYNASMMSTQVLSRVYSITNNAELKQLAQNSMKYCLNAQKSEGSWSYGAADFHQWIDSFHTGYVLTCLNDYAKYCQDNSVYQHVKKGLDYYLKTFFNRDGSSNYYSNHLYPIDINNPAGLVITLDQLSQLKQYSAITQAVMIYTIKRMQSAKGYFYYQKNFFYVNRTCYLRWSNSWAFYALSIMYLNDKS
jgi:hypothetical protein